MARAAEAGRKGADVRSDCWVSVTPTDTGGLGILGQEQGRGDVRGGDPRGRCGPASKPWGSSRPRSQVEDFGALPFVLMARLEAAVRRAYGEAIADPGLPEVAPETRKPTRRDRFRRSRLYLPGQRAEVHVQRRAARARRRHPRSRGQRGAGREGRRANDCPQRPARRSTSSRRSGWSASTRARSASRTSTRSFPRTSTSS